MASQNDAKQQSERAANAAKAADQQVAVQKRLQREEVAREADVAARRFGRSRCWERACRVMGGLPSTLAVL